MPPIRSIPETSVDPSKARVAITSAKDSPFETQCVLATCQSLALLDGEVVGDPLEKACLTAINWNLNKGQYSVV